MSKKSILLLVTLLGAICLVAWKLRSNMAAKATKTELSKIVSSFVPVETEVIGTAPIDNRLEADGIFLPGKEMFIISETAGRVLEIFRKKGDTFQEGEALAKVDDELLRIEMEATQANLVKLRKDRERLNNLIEGEAAPKNKIEDLELGIVAAEAKEKVLRKQINNTLIKAPMKGTLGLRFIERGTVIGPGIQIGQMTDLSKLFLMVKVTERDVLHIQKGMKLKVLPDVYPGVQIDGTVTNIGLRADNSFTYDVEIEVLNPQSTPLRGGMHGKAVFQFSNNRRSLVLSRRAVTGSLQDAKVFVVTDSVVTLRPVTLGLVQGDKVEVISGLREGEQIVTSGQLNLTEGSKIRVIGQKQ